MKRLIILSIIFLLVNSTAFSQSATKDSTKSSVNLPEKVAKEVVKDIYRGDSLQSELNIVNDNYRILQSNLIYKDSIISIKDSLISLYKLKENSFNALLDLKDQKYNLLAPTVTKLNKDLKKQTRKTRLHDLGLGAVILGLAYLLITK